MHSSSSSTLFLNTLPPPSISKPLPLKNVTINPIDINRVFHNRVHHKHSTYSSSSSSSTKFVCKAASSSSSSSWINEFDLYELLGVESSSDQSEIKKAYRSLQKRCHPDIAGPAGHDMAIILNEVYSLLSDPNSRSFYDQEQAKLSEFSGYTGKPLYSAWFGSEKEHRAVFVDEVRCVGCLKCALHADKTFAIESVYGRARVIAQWADSEDKILDAIGTCPVDCINMVERSDLAALEFLMSKQPRGSVRMTAGNTGGERVSNIFADVNKFQSKFQEIKEKASKKESKESDSQRNSRISAVQGIRSFSNWWYWRTPSSAARGSETATNLMHIPRNADPDIERIREAAAKLKSRENAAPVDYKPNEEYWTPMLILPSPSNGSNSTASSPKPPPMKAVTSEDRKKGDGNVTTKRKRNPMNLRLPLAMAIVSSVMVANGYGDLGGDSLNEHVGGSSALEVVNSFQLQVILAGTTWFVIGLGIVGIFEVFGGWGVFRRK